MLSVLGQECMDMPGQKRVKQNKNAVSLEKVFFF